MQVIIDGVEYTPKNDKIYRDDKGRGYSTTEQDEEVAWNALRAWCEKKGISLYDLYPKTEWGEEDERMLERAIHIIVEYSDIDEKESEIVQNWLNSLRPQPKKGLVLTEEQEKKFGHLFSYSHWKPSDDQMNRLCAVVDAAIRKHNESVSGYEPARVLKSLYEDLKKL